MLSKDTAKQFFSKNKNKDKAKSYNLISGLLNLSPCSPYYY